MSSRLAVVFEVEFERQKEKGGPKTAVGAIETAFGRTKPLPLQENGRNYQGGNIQRVDLKDGTEVVTGLLGMERIVQGLRHDVDERGLNVRTSAGAVRSDSGSSHWVFDPETSRFTAWVSSLMPYTRYLTFFKRVDEHWRGSLGLTVDAPRTEWRARDQIRKFDQVDWLKVRYTKARSPGVPEIDVLFDEKGFHMVSIRADGVEGGMRIERVLELDTEIGKAIEHIQLNPRNGVVSVSGRIDGVEHKMRSNDRVALHRFDRPASASAEDVALVLARVGRSVEFPPWPPVQRPKPPKPR